MPNEESPIDAVSSALTRLAGEVYADVARPSAKQIGTALETLFKVGLSPVKLLDWGYEQSKDWLAEKIRIRLAETPTDLRVAPLQSIVVSAVAHISTSHDAPEMRELFVELLLKAMDKRTAQGVHPAYVPLLAQLSPQEALVFISLQRLVDENIERSQGDCIFMERRESTVGHSTATIEMQFAAHCESLGFSEPSLPPVWLGNLQRLALLQTDRDTDLNLVQREAERLDARLDHVEYRYLYITEFGQGFLRACSPPES